MPDTCGMSTNIVYSASLKFAATCIQLLRHVSSSDTGIHEGWWFLSAVDNWAPCWALWQVGRRRCDLRIDTCTDSQLWPDRACQTTHSVPILLFHTKYSLVMMAAC